MQKASLTWEWTAGSLNINSAELLLNWPLCVETPDGKCLFLFLSAVKTWPLFLNAVSGMSGCALGSERSNPVARLYFSLCWHFIRMETIKEQYKVIFFIRTKWPKKMEKPRHTNGALSHVFQENSRKYVLLIINLVFQSEKNKVSIVWWSDQKLAPLLATAISLQPFDYGVNLWKTGGKGLL